LCSFHAAAQNKSNYLKTPRVWNWKIIVWINIFKSKHFEYHTCLLNLCNYSRLARRLGYRVWPAVTVAIVHICEGVQRHICSSWTGTVLDASNTSSLSGPASAFTSS
jgi:hypothetical protein